MTNQEVCLLEMRRKEVSDLLVERNKKIKKMLEEVARSKDIEKELFETNSDVEMLQTQLNLAKKMESMSRSNRLSVLKEVTEETESKKEELVSVNNQLFPLMHEIDTLRNEVSKAKKEISRFERILRKYDVKIQKLNSKMLMAKSKLRIALSAKERVSSLANNLLGSFVKLEKNKESSKEEERLLKEEKSVKETETEETKVEINEKERELISILDELEKAKQAEALVLEKLESLIEETMENREHCSKITISRFEYEYLSKHASQAEETADKKVEAAEAWVEALKESTKAVLMKTETLMREGGMVRVEEEREVFRTEMSLSKKRLVEEEIQKIKRNPETHTPMQQGKKPRRYSSAGTPTFFVIKKKKKKVPSLVKFFGPRR